MAHNMLYREYVHQQHVSHGPCSHQGFVPPPPPPQRYRQGYPEHTLHSDPNFMFCTFCNGDKNRQDNMKFTHWVKDAKTGQTTCPFLLRTSCSVCLDFGHTAKNCTNYMRVEEMRMEAMSVDPEKSNKLAQATLEEELFRRQWRSLEMQEPKHCGFCANGYKDNFHKTHNTYACPRLACTKCQNCGYKGHTRSKCPLIIHAHVYNPHAVGDFVFDFDKDEIVRG